MKGQILVSCRHLTYGSATMAMPMERRLLMPPDSLPAAERKLSPSRPTYNPTDRQTEQTDTHRHIDRQIDSPS